MKSFLSLLIIVCMAGFVSAGFGQQPGRTTDSGEAAAAMDMDLTFPYEAEITGDDVYFRSGGGVAYYYCGKLNKGDRVTVADTKFGWSCIVAPKGSFSWISSQYVSVDPENPTTGIVTGDDVRVYAGADHVQPLHSTSMQLKLNRGEKVTLLGEKKDNYYKIAPPKGAYLWVNMEFTKPYVPPVEVPPVAIETPPVANETPIEAPSGTESQVPQEVPVVEVPPVTIRPVNVEAKMMEQYQNLSEQIDAEREKPLEQQNYVDILKSLREIAGNEAAGKAARYSEYLAKQIERFQLAVEITEKIKNQEQQQKNIVKGIEKARQSRLEEAGKMGRFAVIGQLENFTTYGPGHYRILDESGKTICYAVPDSETQKGNSDKLIGRKVGLVGVIEPHPETGGSRVSFTEIVELK